MYFCLGKATNLGEEKLALLCSKIELMSYPNRKQWIMLINVIIIQLLAFSLIYSRNEYTVIILSPYQTSFSGEIDKKC